ncbi:methyltransferase [Hyphomicrobium nitrativorans NL23]|uniref:Methyltransferase n=1 Tax=Hyphomicrobium nitrativorans NL23 TaxID=1029756 RepID=V5SDN1_9HYPH|nr:methyltransferase [Hyphomicrobium nitrativorans]AHB48981.1 methyltransferase [Hyphomicrobium nitrativorans NL23]
MQDRDAASGRGNADYAWKEFDSEAYFQHYYGEPHPDDDLIVQLAVAALKRARPLGDDLDVVDIGTGPNLIPFFCALPRARRLTAWEFSGSNVAWLKREFDGEGLRPQWRHFWDIVREAYGEAAPLPDNPLPALREKCSVTQGSIFDLPPRAWDAATMFFCAESITKRQDEFEAACAAFARSVRPGGTLAAAFLARSEGYLVSDYLYPALNLSADGIEQVFAAHAEGIETRAIGIVEREIRSGYSGVVFLTGLAR